MKNPIFVALDVDSDKEAQRIVELTAAYVGGFKVGPRLIVRYGADFLKKIAERGTLFVDNKYFDIPSTMEGAIRASFRHGARVLRPCMRKQALKRLRRRLAAVEKELNQKRPFKILAVTVLTSFNAETLPSVLKSQPISKMVEELAGLAIDSGINGLVCSPDEVAILRKKFPKAFLLVPGIRMEGSDLGDQKCVADPVSAIRNGASALVVGRPIYQADNPAQAAKLYANATLTR